jgi:peptide/nickel transport system substrate-binding protein
MRARSYRSALTITVATLALALPASGQQRFQCARIGGDFVLGLEAKVPTYDQHVSTAGAARNIAAHMFEALMTRDEKMAPMLSLAESLTESPDGPTFVFKLRQGVSFHNGKPMTSADVVASYERYKRVGAERNALAVIDRWEAPDAETFVIHLKERQATFLDAFSNFTACRRSAPGPIGWSSSSATRRSSCGASTASSRTCGTRCRRASAATSRPASTRSPSAC